MMLMHSMNKLASNFFERLSTPPTLDTGDDDRSASNTTEEGDADTEGNSSATEGDLTIRNSSAPTKKNVVTLWDDSDVSDAEATLRKELRPGVLPANATLKRSDEMSSGTRQLEDGGAELRPPTMPWGHGVRRAAAWKPQATLYRSLSFELDSAGNTIRPKPKRQRAKEREKMMKDKKHERQHRNTDAIPPAPPNSNSLEASASQDLTCLVSPLTSPKPFALTSSSSHTSEDETATTLAKERGVENDGCSRERERPRKKKRSKVEKGLLCFCAPALEKLLITHGPSQSVRSSRCTVCGEVLRKVTPFSSLAPARELHTLCLLSLHVIHHRRKTISTLEETSIICTVSLAPSAKVLDSISFRYRLGTLYRLRKPWLTLWETGRQGGMQGVPTTM